MFCANYLPVFHMIKNWTLISPPPIYIHFISTHQKVIAEQQQQQKVIAWLAIL